MVILKHKKNKTKMKNEVFHEKNKRFFSNLLN